MEQATLPGMRDSGTRRSFPPGPHVPAVLQVLRLARDPLNFLVNYQRRYGDLFTVRFPFFPRLVYVADPVLVKQIFTSSADSLHPGEANGSVLEPVLGPNSVLTLDGRPHMRQRKLLLPPFHGKRIQRYEELIRSVTRREMESWPVGEPFALRPSTQRITMAVILQAVFGVHDDERLRAFERLIDRYTARVELITSFPPLRRNFGRFSPWGRFLRARDELDAFLYEEIRLRRAEAADRDDVLSLLLAARDEKGEPMTDEELRDELVTVLAAGHETTATGLAWAMERLTRNPEVLERLRESLPNGDEYLEATIKETLRTRPVLIDVARKVVAPVEIGGYRLPPGTFLMAAIAALHYREDLFSEPDLFRPERFLDGRADTYAWIPFGGGVRRCVGAAFAEYEMRVVLRELVGGARLRAADPAPERPKIRNITMAPARGTMLVQGTALSSSSAVSWADSHST
ncbi:MAG: cytochrome P450 [Solirubrobacterales bacterium]